MTQHTIGTGCQGIKAAAIFAVIVLTLALTAPCGATAQQWTPLQPQGFSIPLYAIDFPTQTTGYAIGWSQVGSAILRTTDAGATWTESDIPDALLFAVHFFNPDTGIVAGYVGSCNCGLIMQTTDGGVTWTSGTYTSSLGFYGFSFPTADSGFICGYNGTILKTTDRGQSWRKTKTSTSDVFRRIQMATPEVGYAVAGHAQAFNRPTEIFKTTDGGEHWNVQHDYYEDKIFGDLWFTDANTGFLAGNDGHESIYRTTNGGTSWESIYTGPDSEVLQGIRFTDPSNGAAVGTNGRVLTTSDGGKHWALGNSGTIATLLGIGGYGNSLFALGSDGTILKHSVVLSVPLANVSNTGGTLIIVPHPIGTSATMRMPDARAGDRYRFTLFDVRGNRVLESSDVLHGNAFEFQRGDIPAGSYYYMVVTSSGTTSGHLILQ
ncbi:MAG TPA: hypothetical protein VHI13_22835 [Candidatus Kapabacteria bacterium]|nr:hypothetical protein [Candidatus Kapabacteria bacterium]